MMFFSKLDAALQSHTFDAICAPVTRLPAWASDGTLIRLALTWAVTWLVARALTRAAGHQTLLPAVLRDALAAGVRPVGAAADRRLAHWSRRLAAGYAAWLDVRGLSRTAARVRMVNGVA